MMLMLLIIRLIKDAELVRRWGRMQPQCASGWKLVQKTDEQLHDGKPKP